MTRSHAFLPLLLSAALIGCPGPKTPVNPPTLTVAATSVAFGPTTAAGAAPAAKTVAVTYSGGGTISSITTALAYAGAARGWLDVALSGAAPNFVLTLGPSSTALPAGTHQATVTIGATGASSKTVAVTFEVAADAVSPVLAVDAPVLTFTGTSGGAAPTAQDVAVLNAGTGTLDAVTVTTDQPWLAATATGCPGTSCKVAVEVSAGVTVGGHAGTVTLTVANAANSPLAIPVIYVVMAPPPVVRDASTAAGGAAILMDDVFTKLADCMKAGAPYVAFMSSMTETNAIRIQASVDAGRMTYDESALSGCRSAIGAATCSDLEAGEPAACKAVLAGVVAVGDPCLRSEECASGWCKDGGTCPFLCAAKKADGEVCSSDGECTSDACNTTTHLCVANAPGAAGESCGWGDAECQAGLYCRTQYTPSYARICTVQSASGESCTSDAVCAPGLGCADDGTCRPLVAVGESCAAGACGYAAYCSAAAGTRCADGPWRVGDDCAEQRLCWSGLNCNTAGFCVEGTVPPGRACDEAADLFCVDGAFCSVATDTCTAFTSGTTVCP